MRPHLFIFGLGDSAQHLARLAMRHGWKVSGTTRDTHKAQRLRMEGIETFCHSREGGHPVLSLGDYTHILSSIPPQPDYTEPDLAMRRGCWLGYLSTTGVYGDWDGAWVDENAELRGTGERLKRRIAAEKEWRAHGGHVFRLAGIYGPGRSVLEDLKAGTARRIDKKGQVFSRIHVADIAHIVFASMRRPSPGSTYNVCDDEPAPAHEVVAHGARLLGIKPPPLVPYEQAQLSPMGHEFYAANRRVNNEKIKRELGVSLIYPTYREGLAQCLQNIRAE